MERGVQDEGHEVDEQPAPHALLGGCPESAPLLPALHVAERLLLDIPLRIPVEHIGGRVFLFGHVAAHEGVETTSGEGLVPFVRVHAERLDESISIDLHIEEPGVLAHESFIHRQAVVHVELRTVAQVGDGVGQLEDVGTLPVWTEDDDKTLGHGFSTPRTGALLLVRVGEIILECVAAGILDELSIPDDPVVGTGIRDGLLYACPVISCHEYALQAHLDDVVKVLLGEVGPVEHIAGRRSASADHLLPEEPEGPRVRQASCELHIAHRQAGGEAVDDHHVQLSGLVTLLVVSPGHIADAFRIAGDRGRVDPEPLRVLSAPAAPQPHEPADPLLADPLREQGYRGLAHPLGAWEPPYIRHTLVVGDSLVGEDEVACKREDLRGIILTEHRLEVVAKSNASAYAFEEILVSIDPDHVGPVMDDAFLLPRVDGLERPADVPPGREDVLPLLLVGQQLEAEHGLEDQAIGEMPPEYDVR